MAADVDELRSMRDMTDAELFALTAMRLGGLDPIADLLAREADDLHPILRRELVNLIRGSADQVDFRLKVEKHPDLKRTSQGPKARGDAQQRSVEIALCVMRHGGFTQKQWEAAILEAGKEFGIKRSSVAKHWEEQKPFLIFLIKRGFITDTHIS